MNDTAQSLTGRPLYLAIGRENAGAIAAIVARGMPAALEAVARMGGVSAPRAIARDLVRLAQKVGPVWPHQITRHRRRRFGDGVHVMDHVVSIPHLTWTFDARRKQRGKIEWVPMFTITTSVKEG